MYFNKRTSYIDWNEIKEALDHTLKDYGIDWILEEHGSDYEDLLGELILSLSRLAK